MKYPKRSFDLLPHLVTFAIVQSVYLGASAVAAATIWNGPPLTFSKADFADPTLAENQDHLTTNVWFTRGGGGGIYNVKTEGAFTPYSSPADTEWSYGELADYASLTYTNWEALFGGSFGGGPAATLNKDTVVHLKTDDIYLSFKLLTWAVGHVEPGGGFSYVRSTPGSAQAPPPPPILRRTTAQGNGSVQFSFTNTPGYVFTVLASTNVELPLTNWTVLGTVTDSPSGFYQFTDSTAPPNMRRCYVVRWP